MYRSPIHRNVDKRLNYIGGQVNGVRKMRNEKRPVYEVFYLILAIKGAYEKLIDGDLDKHMRDELWDDVKALSEVENLSAQDAKTLACIKKEMNGYALKEVAKALKRLAEVKGRYGLLD